MVNTNDITNIIIGVILTIIGFIVVMTLVGSTAGDLTTAAGNITDSGLPLASLFSANGVLLLIFMVAVFLSLILLAFKIFKGK